MGSEIEPETEFANLIDLWKAENQNEGYDPLPFLTRCSKILESAVVEFHKGDPDPFDQRHPKHVLPECKFGKLLMLLENCKDFTDKMTSTYLKTSESPKNVGPIVIAAARLALSAGEGYSITGLDTEEWMNVLISWIINAEEPLRTFATGLIDGRYVVKKSSNDQSIRLITTLLKRLWNYLEPDKYKESECMVVNDNQKESNPKKRKRSTDLISEKPSKFFVKDSDVRDEICVSDLSNSSWAEQMPAMLGINYSLESPLCASLCQCYIFDLLKCFGEFQDFLSTFFRWNVLPLINRYLKNKSEGRLVYKALEFLSTLICHNKAATNFVELDGIRKLIDIPRPSMGSTGVALCLYNLAYRKEVMEKICQPPAHILRELVKYAVWLLECSHESGKSHIALFFSLTFSYRNVLSLFDNMNGLRYLVNMICTTKPIVNAASNEYDMLEDPDLPYTTSQIIKSVCVALRKYFEAHIVFKVGQLVKSCPVLKRKFVSFEFVSKYESATHTRDRHFEYFDVLRELADKSSNFNLESWAPIALFQRLDGVSLLLKIIHMIHDLESIVPQVEVGRAALDVLCAVTLSRSCQMMLTKRYPNLGLDTIGLNIILDFIENGDENDDTYAEGVSLNSAIAVIANCTQGTCAKSEDDSESLKMHGTPKYNKKKRKVKETLCKLIQQANGIKTLLSLLEVTEPAQTADETRYFACKALVGLAEYRPVRQILSKLHVFISKLLPAIQEPVLKDKKELHVKFCGDMEFLLKRITGKAITLDADLKTVQRTDVVSETRVRYLNKDVLSMIYNHLIWSGLDNAAMKVAQDAGLFPDNDDNVFATPKSVRRLDVGTPRIDGLGDRGNKITFSRGNRASSSTPTSTPIINLSRRSLRNDTAPTHRIQDRYTLSGNGFVTANSKVSVNNRSAYPVTLNSIIEEHFKHQHSKCRNPVVTVPHFSLFAPHHCPEPSNKIEASINVHKRHYYRQGVYPRTGGIGGMGHDLRMIYSRFRPAGVIKSTEDRKSRFTSVAFIPNDDCGVILGDSAGNFHFPKVSNFKDRVVTGISDSAIIHIEPSYSGDVMLTISPTYWSCNCVLLAMNDTLDQKLTFDDIDFVEFSKTVQDKIVGTRDYKAIIYDANTGAAINTYGKDELSCNYKMNCATFSYDDRLVLSDGLLWDVRKAQMSPIHKFDKFNQTISGVFHPNGLEVIINTEVWDMRNFNLIQSIPTLDQCQLLFNRSRTVMYAMKIDTDDQPKQYKGLMSAFRTFDSSNYNQLGFISVKQQVYALALDDWDRNIAIIETPSIEDSSMSVCRMYEVGMMREDDEEEEEDNVESGYDVDSTDDSSLRSDDIDDVLDDGGDDFSNEFSQDGSEGSFSLNGEFSDGSGWETMDDEF